MATLNPYIKKDKRLADGRYTVLIALRHKTSACYMSTPVKVDSLTQFRGGRIVRRPDAAALNSKIQDLIVRYQNRLDEIDHLNLYTAAQLKKMIEKDDTLVGNTFNSIKDIYLSNLKKEGRERYAVSVERACRYFTDYLRGDILLCDITPAMVEGYTNNLRTKKLSEATVSTMLAQLKAVVNKAVKEQLVEYKVHPFSNTKITAAPVRRLDLSLDNFNKIKNAKVYIRNRVVARDLFLLSFYLGGVNLIDIMSADFRGDRVIYSRSKASSRTSSDISVEISITSDARAIIDRWIDRRTGRLDFGYKYTYHNFSQYVTYSLKKLAEEVGVDERISFYSARKSFAQYASELGIPESVIDYCLGHSDRSKGIIRYYTHVKPKQADLAIARVVDYTNNPDKYSDYLEMRNDIMMMRG